MIDEEKLTKKASEELIEMSRKDYFPEPSDNAKLNAEKVELKRRLLKIEEEEKKIDPQVLAERKERLHKARLLHERDARLHAQQIDQQFSQMTHTDKDGQIIYGS